MLISSSLKFNMKQRVSEHFQYKKFMFASAHYSAFIVLRNGYSLYWRHYLLDKPTLSTNIMCTVAIIVPLLV